MSARSRPRKNLRRLVDAFASRSRSGDLNHQLVCVGPCGWLSRDIHSVIERSGVADAITFTGYVPFAELPALYSLAEMFVFRRCTKVLGCPSSKRWRAARRSSPVAPRRCLKSPGTRSSRWMQSTPKRSATRSCVWRGIREHREHLSVKGRERAGLFSWRRAARETLAVRRLAAPSAASSAGRSPAAATIHVSLPAISPTGARPAPPWRTMTGRRRRHETNRPTCCSARRITCGSIRSSGRRSSRARHSARSTRRPSFATRGYSVAVFDAMLAESEADWAAALDTHRPRFAVIYEDNFNYLTKMCLLRMRQAALTMIDEARARGITTIVAGSDATDHAQIYLARGADVVIIGEGERTLIEALDVLAGRARPPESVAGLCLRSRAGLRGAHTGRRDVIRDLDALPLPAWDLIDVERYRADLAAAPRHVLHEHRHDRAAVRIHCNWCAKPLYGQRYTVRSPEHVVDEIAWLKTTYRPDHLWIADDIFGLKPGWIERFARPRDSARRGDSVQVPAAGRIRSRRPWPVRFGPRLPHRVDRRRVGIAANPRCDGEGHRRAGRSTRRRDCCTKPASKSASSSSSAIRARRAPTSS